MKFIREVVALIIVLTMSIGFVACGRNTVDISETETQDTTTSKDPGVTDVRKEVPPVDHSKQITLVLYLLGNEPDDMETVENAINKKLVEKFNTKLDFQFTSWTDYKLKYNNTLTTGGADIIFTAGFVNYKQLAQAGAYLDLEDLMRNYAPDLYEYIGESKINSCRVNGSLYMISNMWDEYVSEGIFYRKDLCEEYNLPEPTSWDNMYAYFQGLIDAGYSGSILNNEPDGATADTFVTDNARLLTLKKPGLSELDYGYMYQMNDPFNLYDYWYSDDFVNDAKLMKQMCDNGWWSRSCLSSQTGDTTALAEGRVVAFVDGYNPNKYVQEKVRYANNGEGDYEFGWYEYGWSDGNIYPNHPTGNGTSITSSCKYPERAMEVIQYIMMDDEMNQLVQCGIESKHYKIDDNGYYVNIDPSYGYEGANTWNFRNSQNKLRLEADTELLEIFEYDNKIAQETLYPNTNIILGFQEDYSEFSAERTALMNVVSQYLNPIFAGVVNDPEAAVMEFRAKAEQAGLAICREAYEDQWKEYCEEMGYTKSRQ